MIPPAFLYTSHNTRPNMKKYFLLVMTIVATIIISSIAAYLPDAMSLKTDVEQNRKAPPSITGENVYVAWWTNNTANSNEEIMFRATRTQVV